MKRLFVLLPLILLTSCNGGATTSSGASLTSGSASTSKSSFMNNDFYEVYVVPWDEPTFSIYTGLTRYKFNDRGFKAYGDDGRVISELNCYLFYNNTYYLDNNLRYTGTSSNEYTKFFVVSDDMIIGELLNGDHDRFVTVSYAKSNNIEVITE